MDILLIDPPYRSLKGLSADKGYNVGLTSLAAYLRQEGFDTAVLMGDLLLNLPATNMWLSSNHKKNAVGQQQYEQTVSDKTHIVWKKLGDVIRRKKPRAVGISYFTTSKYVVSRIADLVRDIDPDIKVVVGSFHPTFCPDEVMKNPDIDIVVRGEGEIPLLHLVKELRKENPSLDMVPGIHYRDERGRVHSNPDAEMIRDLDTLPFLARDLVMNCDYDRYRGHSISTARGCPYTCAFCSDRSLWHGKVRRRSVDNVIEELRLLKSKYKADYVLIVDGTFTYDRRYVHDFCNALIDQKLNISWRCSARYDNLDEDMLRHMKRANCTGLYIGLESGSDRVLKSVGKRITVDKIIEVSKMVHASGIPSVTSVLLGLPDEGKEDMKDTLRLMKKIKTEIIDVNSYVPLPGTPLYKAMSEEEKKNVDYLKVAYKSFNNHFTKGLSQAEFKKYTAKAYKIANRVRRRTILRFAAKMLLGSRSSKSRKQPQATQNTMQIEERRLSN